MDKMDRALLQRYCRKTFAGPNVQFAKTENYNSPRPDSCLDIINWCRVLLVQTFLPDWWRESTRSAKMDIIEATDDCNRASQYIQRAVQSIISCRKRGVSSEEYQQYHAALKKLKNSAGFAVGIATQKVKG